MLFFIFSVNANAFFEKTLLYRNQQNRPPFLEDRESPGRFYLGGGFSWGVYGRLNDTRGLGMSESFNKGLYSAEKANDYPNQPDFSHSTKNLTHGYVVFGYAPRDGWLSFTRHELELGTGGYTKTYPGIDGNNLFCLGGGTCTSGYSTLSYTLKQKYLMYNLYLHTDMKEKLNYFMGGGIGASLLSLTFSGSSGSSSTTESEIEKSANAVSPVYSVFWGVTYDVSDSIVIQGRLKGMFTQTPKSRLSGGSISYTSAQYGASSKILISTFGLDVSILFGW